MHTFVFTHNFGNEGLTKTWYDMHFQIVKIEIDSEAVKLKTRNRIRNKLLLLLCLSESPP